MMETLRRELVRVLSNPRVLTALVGWAIGGMLGWLVVTSSGVGQPFKGIFFLMFLAVSPLAAVLHEREPALSRRLAFTLICMALGLMVGRLAFVDLLRLSPGDFRTFAIAWFGFLLGFVGFMKYRGN